jgi:hypothetical protein
MGFSFSLRILQLEEKVLIFDAVALLHSLGLFSWTNHESLYVNWSEDFAQTACLWF